MRSGVQRAACGCSLANFRVRRDALEMSWSARSADRRVCGLRLFVDEVIRWPGMNPGMEETRTAKSAVRATRPDFGATLMLSPSRSFFFVSPP